MTKLGERLVTATDGRMLGVAEWGVPDGIPVISLHGTPGSRLGRHHDEAMFERLGMHLVTYDRPGYGLSDRHRGRRVVDAVADVESIADAFGFDRFVVGGGSGGSPHAMACAARLGERVMSAVAIVPVAPYEALGDQWVANQAPSNVEEFTAAVAGEAALEDYLGGEVAKMRGDVLSVFDADDDLTASDREAMGRESAQLVLREMLAEAIRQGPYGWLDDDLAFFRHWGFELAEIQVPLLVAYAANDTLAPRAHGDYLAAAIPGAQSLVMDAGHLSAMNQAEEYWSRVLGMAASRP
jgi:pimeloyl-ACP methyl ester carboxylesterase